MNRRSFLQRFAIGTAGALAFASLPAPLVKVVCGRQATAIAILRRVYNAASQGRFGAPMFLVVGGDLYEAYEDELTVCKRFSDADAFGSPTLLFKATRVVSQGRGWSCRASYGYAENTTVAS